MCLPNRRPQTPKPNFKIPQTGRLRKSLDGVNAETKRDQPTTSSGSKPFDKPFDFCGSPLNHYWKQRAPKPFLRFEPQNNTQKLRNILFNSQTEKYTKIRILILMGRLMLQAF
jgi:hypothetical protein